MSKFTQAASEKGLTYAIILYLFFGFSLLLPLITLVVSIFTANSILIMFSLAIIIAAIFAIARARLDWATGIIAIPYIVLMSLITLISMFFNASVALYSIVVVSSIITGLVLAFLYSKLDTIDNFLKHSISFSSVIAVIFGLNKIIQVTVEELNHRLEALQNSVVQNTVFSMFSSPTVNIEKSFLLTMILCNLPFILLFTHRQGKMKEFGWYVLPVAIFVLLLFLAPMISSLIIGQNI